MLKYTHIPSKKILDGCKPILKFTKFPKRAMKQPSKKRKKKNTKYFRKEENA